MIVVSLHGIKKAFATGGDILLGVDWEIQSGQKIALVGRNGSGKTTLMGIVVGRMEPDSGTRTLGRGARIVEMGLIPDRGIDITLFNYILEARQDLLDMRQKAVELAAEVAAKPDDRIVSRGAHDYVIAFGAINRTGAGDRGRSAEAFRTGALCPLPPIPDQQRSHTNRYRDPQSCLHETYPFAPR